MQLRRIDVLSVVIPTLNAAAALAPTLTALDEATSAGLALEIIVSDGGSSDATVEVARQAGGRVVAGPPGRGRQLAAGADAARGAWLLFLHADTRLAPGWSAIVARYAEAPANVERAAYFRFALDETGPAARALAALVALRCRLFALPYGDQGLLIAQVLYRSLGGYRSMPLMEDVDLIRRLGRRRLVPLPHPAITSAERYRRDGWLVRPLRNLLCLALYFAGMDPGRIVKIYR